MNEAAKEICVNNPTMLRNRGRLLEAAKQKVHEGGYAFKKGKSRSKTYGTPYSSQAKRTKMTHDVIEDRMKQIEDDLKNKRDLRIYKEKPRTVAETAKNYKLCADITEELGELTRECHILEAELKLLQKKDKRCRRYQQSRNIPCQVPVQACLPQMMKVFHLEVQTIL